MSLDRRLLVRGGRVAFGVLVLVALISAVVNSNNVGNFFSYFTIESNLLAAVVLLVSGFADPDTSAWRYVRGAATLYMTITGVVCAVLLADQTVGLSQEWINTVLHRVTPLALLIDWVLFAPWPRLSYREAMGWLIYPVVYLIYSLSRGPVADFYPYPFLDPRRDGGYGRVVIYAAVLAVCMAAIAAGVNWIARTRSRTQTAATTYPD